MQLPVETSPSRVLTFPSLAVLALGGATLSCLFVPNHSLIRERFEKNKLASLITPVLADARWQTDVKPADTLLGMSMSKLDELAALSQLPPQEQLAHFFTRGGSFRYDEVTHAFTLAAVRDPQAIDLTEAFATIRPKLGEIPEKQRLEVLDVLATNALATSQPDLAADALVESCHASTSTWPIVKDMISAARFAAKPAVAIEELRHWMQAHGEKLGPIEQIEAKHLHYTLAMDCDLPGEALDLCLADLEKVNDVEAITDELMESAFEAATLAVRTKELLPWIESRLATFEEAALSPQELLSAKSTAGYQLWIKRAADIADACGYADKAFAHHERLLAMGDTSGLDRLLPLATQVHRSEEAWGVIQSICEQPGKDRMRLQCARVIAANGRTAQAVGLYESWIANHPTDREAAYELACLKERTGDVAGAVAEFEKFLRAFPRDVAGVKKLAALRIRNHQPESALREFDDLPDADHDAASLEDYAMLAESLGRTTSLLRALRLSAADAVHASPALFIRMADLAKHNSPDDDSAAKILEDAIQKLPRSPTLRVKLASLYLDKEQYHPALEQSLHPIARQRTDAIAIAIAAAIHIDRSAEVLAMLGADIEKKTDLPLATRLHLAVACSQTGDAARAETLFASVQPTPSTFSRLAEARLLAGQYDKAEQLARQNIVQSAEPQPADWILLGDAQTKLGRADEAQDAYAKALSVVSRKISKKNASDPVAADASNPANVLAQ